VKVFYLQLIQSSFEMSFPSIQNQSLISDGF
jgi:hypothetical protein